MGPANCKCSGVESSWLRGPVALSPDGGQLAFVAVRETGGHVLCVRDLGNGDLQEIADGTRISSPFWSPDGRSIGYIGDAGLTVVEMNGGKPEILTASSIGGRGAGAAWADDGTIVYGGSYRTRLMKVDRMTGLAEPALGPFPDRTTDWPVWPCFLPDGDHFLFTNQDDLTAHTGVYVGSISSREVKPLLLFETNGVYVDPPGAIVYWRGGSLYAHEFDLDRLELVGAPARIATDVWWSTWPAHSAFSVSSSGRLAYLPTKPSEESQLIWYDRATDTRTALGIEGSLWEASLSHDGLRIALDRTTDRTAGDIVVVDIRRGSELRLTRDERNESSPIWSLDDTEIYFFEGPTSTRSSRMEPVRQHSCTPARGQRVHATSAPTGGRCSLPSPIFRIPTNICGYWTWRAVRRSGGLTHQRRRTPGK